MGFGFGMGFHLFGILSTIIFILVMGILLITVIKEVGQWNKNNHSPRLTVPATVVAQRADVTRHRRGGTNGHHHHHTSTTYYVTFQVESGDRMELQMSGSEYGLLIEGDSGNLTFQGTRYLGFDRA